MAVPGMKAERHTLPMEQEHGSVTAHSFSQEQDDSTNQCEREKRKPGHGRVSSKT